MEHFLESIMLLCFGAAWPGSIYKSWTSRSNRGKSLVFLVVIFVGYVAGILKNFVDDDGLTPILWLYLLNGCMVAFDMALYHRNYLLERKTREA